MPDRPSAPGRTPPRGQPAHLHDRPARRPGARPSGETPALPGLGNLPGRTPPGGTPRTSGRQPIVPGPLGPARTSGQQPSLPGPLGPAYPAPGPNGHQRPSGREYEARPIPPRREQRMGSSWASPEEAELTAGPPAGPGAAPEPGARAHDPFADFWSTPTGDGSWLDADPDAPEPGRPRRRPPDPDR